MIGRYDAKTIRLSGRFPSRVFGLGVERRLTIPNTTGIRPFVIQAVALMDVECSD